MNIGDIVRRTKQSTDFDDGYNVIKGDTYKIVDMKRTRSKDLIQLLGLEQHWCLQNGFELASKKSFNKRVEINFCTAVIKAEEDTSESIYRLTIHKK